MEGNIYLHYHIFAGVLEQSEWIVIFKSSNIFAFKKHNLKSESVPGRLVETSIPYVPAAGLELYSPHTKQVNQKKSYCCFFLFVCFLLMPFNAT